MYILVIFLLVLSLVMSSPILISNDIEVLLSDDQCGSRSFTNDDIAQDYREISSAISYAKNVLNEVTRQWEMFQELDRNTNDLEKLNVIKLPDWLPDISKKTHEKITLKEALKTANHYFQSIEAILNQTISDRSFSAEIRAHFETLDFENDRILYKIRDTMCLEYGSIHLLRQEHRPVVPRVTTQSELDYMTFLILNNFKEAIIFLDILFKKLSR